MSSFTVWPQGNNTFTLGIDCCYFAKEAELSYCIWWGRSIRHQVLTLEQQENLKRVNLECVALLNERQTRREKEREVCRELVVKQREVGGETKLLSGNRRRAVPTRDLDAAQQRWSSSEKQVDSVLNVHTQHFVCSVSGYVSSSVTVTTVYLKLRVHEVKA